uniref:Rho GTPase-activating protein 100F n=1 Tax=Anopheles culicifacies TaxID=139723 RepID=A0A182MJU9_9DIPT
MRHASTPVFTPLGHRLSFSEENGRSVPDLTASPGRAPPGPMPSHQAQALQQQQQQHQQQQQQGLQGHHQQQQQQRQGSKEPVLLQGDFRKVSGISSEIFRQIEAVENDHDPSTAAALEVVERRGEMIVRILEPRCMGSRQAIDAGQKFLNKSDARHTVQLVEIVKRPGQTLGLYIREGNGADRSDGVFISRIALESAVYNSGCLRVGDEILAVNLVDVTRMSLDDVVIIMSIPRRLVLAIRQRRGNRGANSPGPPQMSRPEQKPPPVVVIKRDLRDEDLDDSDRAPRSSRSSRERRTGDGREMTESRSRLGLGLNNYSPQSEQLDLYYGGGRGPGGGPGSVETPSWGYKPPAPPSSVITEQPKGMHGGFQTSHSYYQNAGTLESLAEKVHAFYPSATTSRRMSAGPAGVAMSQSHQRFPRSGSDQHLPRVEYADYASLGRHPLLARSSLKSDLVGAAPIAGGTLGRYGRYDAPPQQRGPKYGPSPLGATASLQRRSRPALDYSSDTEATIGPRPSYYYYNHPAMAASGTMGRGSTQALGGGPEFAKFNSLPRERPGATRLGLRGRIADRLQDEADGNVSAPEYSLPIRRDIRDLRNRITASPSIFTSDEYRAWLRRAPSSSAICEQMRASRDLLNQQRAHRFSCSAENIHDVLKNTEHIYSSRTGLGVGGGGVVGGTLDRHSMAAGGPRMSSLPVRSLSSQHIGGPSSIRSPSVRRMRQLLELTQGAGVGGVPGSVVAALTGHQSPAPTPSTTLPRAHRQIDINPAEYTKYKLDKPVVDAVGMSGMLWIHLLAGRGLRAMSETSQIQQPLIRDLYCVLECDRIHKARTVVRSGDLQFDWDESFELDLVCNKQLDVLVYSWDPQHRHKLCYRGALSLTTLLRQSPIHQLALKVEPRGTIYLRLRHTDPFQLFRRRGLPSLRGNVPALFGADLETVVTRESKGAPGCAPVPIILRRCVEEVERRGLDIIGLYRLCGSATKKRLLREAFERNSRAVELTPEHVPDINVITGVLKDYLRELPEPLFTKCLFQMTVDALGVCLPDDPEGNAKLMLSILDCLPRANRATLVFLLDHLSLVVSASERNKMSAQALATALGPPLMLHSASVGANEEIDHAQPIAVLKYLLQIWPQPGTGPGAPTSGTDTIKRGASPASVKFKESTSNYSLKSDTQSRILASSRQHHQPTSASYTNGSTSNGGIGATATTSYATDLFHARSSSLFASSAGSDYLSSTSSIASSVASSAAGAATSSASAVGMYGKVGAASGSAITSAPVTNTLNITTFSLDEKNNLVVSPSPSSASESSYRSSSPASSIQRDKSPNKSGSPSPLRRQDPLDRADSLPSTGTASSSTSTAATVAAAATSSTSGSTSGSSFMSSLRSQTLGSYQFPSTSLKLTSQLSSGSSGQDVSDDGSTSSLLRKLTSSLSRTIVSNTGTLPLSLGREKLSELSATGASGVSGAGSSSAGAYSSSSGIGSISSSISSSIGGSNSSNNSNSGGLRTMSSSLGYTGIGSGASALDGGSSGSGSSSVTTAAAVTSMNIYGTLPKNSSIYSSYGVGSGTSVSASGSGLSGLLSGTTSSYGISERLRALTTGGSGAGDGTTGGSANNDSGTTGSSAGDLDSSGYDYESSGFSSASYSGMATSGASIGSGGGLSSSYFSTGSNSSPFATVSGSGTAGTKTADTNPYRVQYASTNPFLPSFNPTSDGSNGRADSKTSNDEEPFDMK